MAGKSVGGAAGRLWKAAKDADWKTKAKQVTDTLKAEYEAGKSGDDSPSPVLWGSPKEQLDRLLAIMTGGDAAQSAPPASSPTDAAPGEQLAEDGETSSADGARDAADAVDVADADADADADAADAADAAEVADALRGVDWSKVKDSLADRGGNAARTMRSMADQVDWNRVQPVAAHVSSALISAVASGQLPIGGPVSRKVARTVLNQGGLAHKVAEQLRSSATPNSPEALDVPDLRRAIEVASRDVGNVPPADPGSVER